MRYAGEFQRGRIKVLRHERSAAQPQQISFPIVAGPIGRGCVQCVGVRGQQAHRLARLGERGRINAAILTLGASDKVQKAAARKYLRPVVEDLPTSSVQGRERRGLSSGSGDLEKAGIPASKKNPAIVAPGAAAGLAHIADRLGRPARQVDSLQLAVREEGDGLAVRGPEWQPSLFRSGEHPRGCAVQRLDPKSGLPVVRRDIGRGLSVRRQGDAGCLGSKRKLGACGRIDLETQDAFIGGRLPEVRQRPDTQGADRQRHRGRDPPAPAQFGPGGRKFPADWQRKR